MRQVLDGFAGGVMFMGSMIGAFSGAPLILCLCALIVSGVFIISGCQTNDREGQ
jgi:hypothetical protein